LSKNRKVYEKIIGGFSDNNIEFKDLVTLLEKIGFTKRIKGDHNIFTKDKVEEIINIQPKGNKAKNYQVKQVRTLLLKYKLEIK